MAAEYWTCDQVAIWVEGIGGAHASTIGSLFRSLNVDGAALFALTPTAVDTLFARTHLGANVSATELDGCKYRLLWQLEALRRTRLAELERSIALVQGRKPALSASSTATATLPSAAGGMMNGTSTRTAWSEVPAAGALAAAAATPVSQAQPPVMSRRPSIESTTSTGSSSSSIKRRPDSASSASAAGTTTPRQYTSSTSSSQKTPLSANRRRSMSPTRAPASITSPPSSATKPAKRSSPTTPSSSSSSAASSQTHRRNSSSSSQPSSAPSSSSSSTPRPGRRGSVDSTASSSSTPQPAATATTTAATTSGSNGKQTNNNRARSRSRGRARSTSPKGHTNTRSHSKGRQTAQPSAATQSSSTTPTPAAVTAPPTVIGAPALARTSSLPTTTSALNNGSQGSLRRNGHTTTAAKPPPIPPRPASSSVTSTPPPRSSSSHSSSASSVPSTAPAGTRASSRAFSSFSPTSSNPLSVSIPSAPSTPASQNNGAGRERGQSFDSTSSHAPGTPTMSIILTPPLTKQDEQVAGVAKRRLESLTPWFGVELSEETGGVRVKGCKPGSPAEEVGLQPGDLITTLAARAVSTRIQFVTITQQLRVGDRVEMFVTRSGVNDIVFNVQVGSKDVSMSALRQLVLLAEGGMRTTELTSPQRHLLEKTGKFWADDYDRMMEARTAVLPPNGGLANIVDDEDDEERFTPEQLAQRNKAKVAEIARAKQLHAEAREAERREEEEEMRARLFAQKFGDTHTVNGNGYHHHEEEDKDEHYTATQVLHDDIDPAVSSHEAEYKPSSSSQLSSEQKYGTPTAAQHQQHAARHTRSGSGKFNLSTQLARVHQQMDDAEVDAQNIQQFVDHLKSRWALLDEHNEGHVTKHGLKLAVWHNQPDPDQRSLPMPDVLDQELQSIIDEISRGTGNQDSFGFWQFAQYACDDFFADNSEFRSHFPSFRLSPN